MRIIDIINGPWAITPEMLNEIRSIYAKHLRGEKINLKDLGIEIRKKPQGYELVNGTAIIPVEGVIAKKMNLFSQISGGASTQLIERDIRDALNDPSVQKIILAIDSPGGTIDGTFELAEFIFEQRGKKPIYAYTDGQMASAAYAIAAAADKIFISGNTTMVGSIGVVAVHEDISKFEEKLGIKTSEIYSGKYKRIVSQYEPLSEEGRKTIQDEVDYLYTVFIDAIAKFRGTSAEDVLVRMSTDTKRIFIGYQAIEAGLVDGVATLESLVNNTAAGIAAYKAKGGNMTKEELKANHPDLYNEIFAEGAAKAAEEMISVEDCEKKKEDMKKEGAKAERERIMAIKAQAIPGHEALIEAMMFDGVTTPEQAAMKILAAEKSLRESKLEAFKKDGEAIKVAVSGEQVQSNAVDSNLPVEERAKAEWDKDAGLRGEFGGNFNAYLAFKKADEAGKVKILGRRS